MTGKPLILCADDSPGVLEGWKALLKREGYEVLTATNGKEALQVFVSHPVDLVLLDYHMPEMNGDLHRARWKLLTLLCLSRSAYPGFWKSWTTCLVYVFCFSRSVTWKKRTAAKRP